MWGAFQTYHNQLTLVNNECNTWVMFWSSNELRLWFRQGQLTIESSDSDLDKVLSIWISSCGFKFHVAIKDILLHCNYH